MVDCSLPVSLLEVGGTAANAELPTSGQQDSDAASSKKSESETGVEAAGAARDALDC